MLGCRRGEHGIEWNLSAEIRRAPGDLRVPGSGAPSWPVPATPSPIADQGRPRREERCLDQHLATLPFDGTTGRDEDELTVRVRRLAGRRFGDIDVTCRRCRWRGTETGQGFPRQRRSRLGQDGIDEFIEGADDIGIVGEHLDDGRVHRTAQVQPFGHEAAGEDQHAGGGHFAQR